MLAYKLKGKLNANVVNNVFEILVVSRKVILRTSLLIKILFLMQNYWL